MTLTRTRAVRYQAAPLPPVRSRTRAVRASVPTPSPARTRTRAVRVSVPLPFVVELTTDKPVVAVEPGTVITVTAVSSGGTASGWAWSTTHSAPISGSGASRQVVAPRRMQGFEFTVSVVVTGSAAATPASLVVQVLPHNEWITTPNGWAPMVPTLL